jgi:hypothetical protein
MGCRPAFDARMYTIRSATACSSCRLRTNTSERTEEGIAAATSAACQPALRLPSVRFAMVWL